MIQRDLLEIFNDCVNRLAIGWTIDECLAEYPIYAAELRSMLEAGQQVQYMRAPQSELIEDQELVWQRLIESEPFATPVPRSRGRRGNPVLGQLIAATFVLILLVGATWFVLNRLIVPPDDRKLPILETLTPTATLTVTPDVTATISPTGTTTGTSTLTTTPSPTLSATVTATVTSSVTPTPTSTMTGTATVTSTSTLTLTGTATITRTPTSTTTSTITRTPVPSPTPTATGTLSVCGEPRTAQFAVDSVMKIYPNTTVTSVLQTIKFGGTPVWEVKTSHGMTVNIDVACGIILSIERSGSDPATPVPGTDTNTNANDNISDDGSSSGGSDSGGDSNSNDNSDDSGGSGMGSD